MSNKWTRVSGPDLDPENIIKYKRNKSTMENNKHFKQACSDAGIPITKRQSSKWNNQKGLAYKTYRGLV